jgi:hypothetical protein
VPLWTQRFALLDRAVDERSVASVHIVAFVGEDCLMARFATGLPGGPTSRRVPPRLG